MSEIKAHHDIAELFDGQAPAVAVIGDLMLDEYLRGSVRRISPEAPVPVFDAAATQLSPGGAANVANNLAALGCTVTLFGAVGADGNGRRLEELARSCGVAVDGIIVDPERVTTHKLRAVAQGQQMVRIDREERAPLSEALEGEVLARLEATLPRVQGVIISDYLKGFLTSRLLTRAIGAARAHGLPVLVDPKGTGYERYRGADVLTPNLHELEVATGLGVGTPADVTRAGRSLLATCEAQAVLVTCGKEGMVLVSRDGEPLRIAAEAREVYDVTGAGDTVIAVFMFALLHGMGYADAARVANTAAGIVVGKLGTATVTAREIKERLHGNEWDTAAKVISLRSLLPTLAHARTAGRRIVFTNGCFDLLHAGHVDYLQAARRLGDLLIVGLNSDRSVREVKGPSRPLVPEGARARVLSALACVDYVVLFDEPTPAEIIAAVRPDVLVKGADYRPEQVVGRELVESYGGRLELIPLVSGQSTSNIVKAILARYPAPVP